MHSDMSDEEVMAGVGAALLCFEEMHLRTKADLRREEESWVFGDVNKSLNEPFGTAIPPLDL